MAHRQGTYSIVARDPAAGLIGVAVQSHWFSVGSVVSWAEAGVGAVATQSVAEPAYGPRLLERLRAGQGAAAALAELLAGDELGHYRQVAVVDAQGEIGVHTGADCIPHAGHIAGEGYSCQANMMARSGVPEAMAAAFESADGDLAERLVVALEAAEQAGGDVRGRQSAALVIVASGGEAWRRLFDLRVEDHTDPVGELRRLVRLQRAYALAGEADELAGAGQTDRAGELYRHAAELAPESDELLFWAGLSQAQAGDLDGGADTVRRAAELNPSWMLLLERLTPELAPSAAAVKDALDR
jgi:uncharacterized Ntn-hydrolase superfamily protein